MFNLPSRVVTVSLFCTLVLVWSFSFLLIKISVISFEPAPLVFWRLIIGALVVSTAAWLSGSPLPRTGKQWRLLAWIALVGNALPFYLIHRGELAVDSGVASLLMGSMPIATCLVAWFVIDEHPNVKQLLGVGLGFCGLVTLIGWDSIDGLGRTGSQLMIAGGALCYAVSVVSVRRAGVPPSLWIAAFTLWVAAVMVFPLAWIEGFALKTPATPGIWASVAALGIACTGLAQVVYFALIGRIQANHFALINNFIPLLGYIWAVWLLAESPRSSSLIAAVLILLGARLVLSGGQSRPATST